MENNVLGQTLQSSYVPPVDWDKLPTDTEKIERVREVVKSLEGQLHSLRSEFQTFKRQMVNHEHIDGKVVNIKQVTEYCDSGLGMLTGESSARSNYF